MRIIISALAIGLMFAMSAVSLADSAYAKTKKSSHRAKTVAKKKVSKSVAKKGTGKGTGKGPAKGLAKGTDEHLQTDVKFDDSVLHGQYQTPDEALTKVENEKGFGDLIGVRKHFKDRLSVASEQE
jgi:hypothetical protein